MARKANNSTCAAFLIVIAVTALSSRADANSSLEILFRWPVESLSGTRHPIAPLRARPIVRLRILHAMGRALRL